MNDAAVIWDGVTHVAARHRLHDAAEAGDWRSALALLDHHYELINATRPGAAGYYAVLHHAANNGAPADVVEELVRRGAWRTMRSAQGERPVDVAERRGHRHLVGLLQPVPRHVVAVDELRLIEQHFHALITDQVGDLVGKYAVRLPQLEPLLEMAERGLMRLPLPDTHGGLNARLHRIAHDAVLVVEGRYRGCGRRHVVSPYGSLLVSLLRSDASRTLQQVCRMKIRKVLMARAGCDLPKDVLELELPQTLRAYLLQ